MVRDTRPICALAVVDEIGWLTDLFTRSETVIIIFEHSLDTWNKIELRGIYLYILVLNMLNNLGCRFSWAIELILKIAIRL